jgi:hypothetical protein
MMRLNCGIVRMQECVVGSFKLTCANFLVFFATPMLMESINTPSVDVEILEGGAARQAFPFALSIKVDRGLLLRPA